MAMYTKHICIYTNILFWYRYIASYRQIKYQNFWYVNHNRWWLLTGNSLRICLVQKRHSELLVMPTSALTLAQADLTVMMASDGSLPYGPRGMACTLFSISVTSASFYWQLVTRWPAQRCVYCHLSVYVDFWETVCKTVRPMLSDHCLSCLSVTLVYCGQTVGWIKMKLGTEVGLGPRHIVLRNMGTQLPLPFFGWAGSPITQCGLSRGSPMYQVASRSLGAAVPPFSGRGNWIPI